MTKPVDPQSGSKPADKPWFDPATPFIRNTSHNNDVAIIGGGIAGASCCYALNQLGIGATLFEQHDHLAQGASGNPIGMLEPYVTADNSLAGQFYEAGYQHSSNLVRQLLAEGRNVEAAFCGALSLPTTPRDASRQQAILDRLSKLPAADGATSVQPLDQAAASDILGLTVPTGGLFYKDAGWVNPPSLCRVLTAQATIKQGIQIARLTPLQGSGARLYDRQGLSVGDFGAVIIAGAMETANFAQTTWMRDYMVALRGQISFFSNTLLEDLKVNCVLSHKGYLTPERAGMHVFGATFDRHANNIDITENDHKANISQLALAVPNLAARLSPGTLGGRAGLRTTTPDHLPMIGPAPDYAAYLDAYPDLDKGRYYARYCSAPYHKDVYVCTGFGARGMIGAPLAANMIACQIAGHKHDLPSLVQEALHPARYIIRAIKRGLLAP